ncbi:deoxyribonuclease V [Thermopolyspora sp. NPDC052614]|uniref:deoxyribonuclease V n=1 Tax=Thermopolyspora sp. NPDC052614 TaxID=3155682 RepID=UPI00343F8003
MRVSVPHAWPSGREEAEAVQDRLRPLVRVEADGSPAPPLRLIAGLDVAYAKDDDRLAAAVVVLDADTLAVVESVSAVGRAAFPYIPGLFAFRELPTLVTALERLTTDPDLLVCDGQGIAHPRRFGLACHLGVLTDLPAIGIAKQSLVGEYAEPERPRGSWTPVRDGGEVVGRAVRTQTGVKPVFVSVGHRMSLDAATALALRLSPDYRLPETTRRSDRLSRQVLAAHLAQQA